MHHLDSDVIRFHQIIMGKFLFPPPATALSRHVLSLRDGSEGLLLNILRLEISGINRHQTLNQWHWQRNFVEGSLEVKLPTIWTVEKQR